MLNQFAQLICLLDRRITLIDENWWPFIGFNKMTNSDINFLLTIRRWEPVALVGDSNLATHSYLQTSCEWGTNLLTTFPAGVKLLCRNRIYVGWGKGNPRIILRQN